MGLRPIARRSSVSIYGFVLTRRAAVWLDVATCCISLCSSALGGTRGEPPTSFAPHRRGLPFLHISPRASCSPSLMATSPWPPLLCTPLVALLPSVPDGASSRSTREDRRVAATCRFSSGKSSSELHLPAGYLAPVRHSCARPLLRTSGLHSCLTLVSPREACNTTPLPRAELRRGHTALFSTTTFHPP